MMEVAQEAPVENIPEQVKAELAKEVEGVVERPIIRSKRVSGTAPVIEGKVASDRVKISDTELLQIFRIENTFLKNTQQIAALTQQNESIQKTFPDHIKSLAEKYGVDVTKKLFDSTTGEFRDKP